MNLNLNYLGLLVLLLIEHILKRYHAILNLSHFYYFDDYMIPTIISYQTKSDTFNFYVLEKRKTTNVKLNFK